MGHVEQIARRYVENGKRKLHWQSSVRELDKEHAKLLVAVLAVALTALPAGGDIYVGLTAPGIGPFWARACPGVGPDSPVDKGLQGNSARRVEVDAHPHVRVHIRDEQVHPIFNFQTALF